MSEQLISPWPKILQHRKYWPGGGGRLGATAPFPAIPILQARESPSPEEEITLELQLQRPTALTPLISSQFSNFAGHPNLLGNIVKIQIPGPYPLGGLFPTLVLIQSPGVPVGGEKPASPFCSVSAS